MDKLLNVLIVEASTEGADLIVDELKRGGYEPVTGMVKTNQAVSSVLREQFWDLIVIDLETLGFDTVDALGEVRDSGACPPVIVVSGATDMKHGACLMRAGARDFIKKDDFARFLPAVERELNEYQRHYNQKFSETALQESEDNFQIITEAAPVGLAIAGYPDGKVLYANPLACEIFGVPGHKLIG
ncbi:MAG: response regulator, partial [Rhodospirillales bacterium]|nr:response regulator [Rhodospirillales bacterium]